MTRVGWTNERLEAPDRYRSAHFYKDKNGVCWWWDPTIVFMADLEVVAEASRSLLVEGLEAWVEKGLPIEMRFPKQEEKRIRVCASVLLTNRKGQVLLAKRKGDVPASGWLAAPAGKIEYGETAMDCVHREFREETGASLSFVKLVDVREHMRTFGHYVIFYFHAVSHTGEIRNLIPEKSEDWQWHDIDKIDFKTCLEPYSILEMIRPKRPN